MAEGDNDIPAETGQQLHVRQPGWVVLVFVLAVACLVIGGMLLGMMQAPVFPRELVAVAWICVAVGLVLIAVAWAGRHRNV